MCTVTYLPLGGNNFILTSNRDETPLRKTIPPKTYLENGVEITYPKDELAGGTWIGTSNKNRLVCLLNGGFENHKRELPYKMSRGIIVKNILSADDAVAYINNFDFNNIEPFTLILADWNSSLETYELVWDGLKKHFNKLPQEPKIWSSSTLYTSDMRRLRQVWFADWLAKNRLFTQEKILQFHNNSTLGSVGTSIKMKREFVETVSVTSILKIVDSVTFDYFDLAKMEV
ncbi:NRDE family protein [Polaribacter vadi]|uniref:NRDE family protein n=1 Tax=Polaribacter TaxID=52959 RepID=UPI001C088B96|nr:MULTISPECIES: NRDE family protein [Polaribacter]MBU3010388.1 NRDE family protein [Polaribacter vadi]MDO6740196.1 NRDE family protein [Polaribacter sp. 1_MG-2023]